MKRRHIITQLQAEYIDAIQTAERFPAGSALSREWYRRASGLTCALILLRDTDRQ
jgi:hypothetical protein